MFLDLWFEANAIIRPDERDKCMKLFDEADDLQRLPAEPIPEEIWIPNSLQDVQAYLKAIAHPTTAEGEHRG